MSEFKVGDRVRVTEAFAQQTVDMAGGNPQGTDLAVAERRALTIVHIDNRLQELWPISTLENPNDYDNDPLGEANIIFNPEELEYVED